MNARLIERFHERYIPEPNSGCWLWTSSTNFYGYGVLWWGTGRLMAHRLSWRLANGEIPGGLVACHKCDVRCCVNPDHLFLGTQVDNMQDCSRKERFPHSRLNAEKVRAARLRMADGESCLTVARSFGVGEATMYDIRARITWKHVQP
jgi:hypothetical protein